MSERLSTRVNQIEKIKYIREEESNLVFLALIFLSFFFLFAICWATYCGLGVAWQYGCKRRKSWRSLSSGGRGGCCCQLLLHDTHKDANAGKTKKKSHAPNGINIEREFFCLLRDNTVFVFLITSAYHHVRQTHTQTKHARTTTQFQSPQKKISPP